MKSSDTNGIRRNHQQQSYNDRHSDHQSKHLKGMLEHDIDQYTYHTHSQAQKPIEQGETPKFLTGCTSREICIFLTYTYFYSFF